MLKEEVMETNIEVEIKNDKKQELEESSIPS